MKIIQKSIVSVAVAAALCVPVAAMATNGILPLGNGMVAHGMGGAGIANGSEAMSGVDNPALVSRTSNQWGVGASLFMPYRSGDMGGGTYVESDSNYFIIPQGGITGNISDSLDWGVLVTALGGMNTNYPDASKFGLPGPSQKLGMDLSGLLIAPTLSMKLAEKHSLGVSLLIGYEMMKTNVAALGMVDAKDSAFGFGLKIGYAGDIMPGTTIGLTYQSQIKMSEMDKQCAAGAALSGVKAAGGSCALNMPQQFGAGIAQQLGDSFKIVADVQRVQWSGVDVFGYSPMKGGFGWKDQTIFKIGGEFKSSESMAWRIGYNYAATPIPDENIWANILAPAITTTHYTFGLGAKVGKGSDINAYVAYIPEAEQSGANPNFGGATARAKMNQLAIGVGYSSSF